MFAIPAFMAPALVTLCKWAHHFGWWIVPCGFFPHGTMPRQPGTFSNFSNTVKTKTQVNSRSLSSPLGKAPSPPRARFSPLWARYNHAQGT